MPPKLLSIGERVLLGWLAQECSQPGPNRRFEYNTRVGQEIKVFLVPKKGSVLKDYEPAHSITVPGAIATAFNIPNVLVERIRQPQRTKGSCCWSAPNGIRELD